MWIVEAPLAVSQAGNENVATVLLRKRLMNARKLIRCRRPAPCS
jgi:hypothetical protein